MAHDLVKLVENMYAATMSGDFEKFAEFLHPDFYVHESDALPFSGRFEGIEGFLKIFEIVFGIYDDAGVEQKVICAGPDHAMVLLDFNARNKTTGEAFTTPMIEMFRFVGDKLIEIKPFYFDPSLLHKMLPDDVAGSN